MNDLTHERWTFANWRYRPHGGKIRVMKIRIAIAGVLVTSLFSLSGARAADRPMDQRGVDRGESAKAGMDHGDDAHHQNSFTFGRPGDAKKVDRTIRIKALGTLRFDTPEFIVRAGETVRFIVTNVSEIRHEFVIGDAAEQREHEKEMQGMRGMVMPDEVNGISLAPEETKSIVWQFAGPGTVELACHEPGHYAAGMVSRVMVEQK